MEVLLLDVINCIYIINLEEDLGRYNHCLYELAKIQSKKNYFVRAVNFNDTLVKEFYKKDKVKNFDSCFRCDDINYVKNYCEHDNNIITPMQVGNFLSFKKVMKTKLQSQGLGLVLEDDFYLKEGYKKAFNNISRFIFKHNLANLNEPLLIRIGSHTQVQKRYNILFNLFGTNKFIKNSYNMANPGFIFNNKFAELFLDKFVKVNTTSDNFIHKILCKENGVVNYSVVPFPISQYTHKSDKEKFISSIDRVSENIAFKNYVNNKEEYEELLNIWTN